MVEEGINFLNLKILKLKNMDGQWRSKGASGGHAARSAGFGGAPAAHFLQSFKNAF